MKYVTIVESTNEILGEYSYPLTLRQIYYRLVSNGVIPNSRSAYNGLSKWLVKAREDGDVDDAKIEDRSRSIIKAVEGYDSPDQFIEAVEYWIHNLGDRYHANLWSNQDVYLEIWVEKEALDRVIARAAQPFQVTVCPTKGYSSYSYIKRDAVDGRFSEVDKPIICLYFGDHDPSGKQMTEDLQRRSNRYGNGMNIEIKRVALTQEQIRKYNLPPNRTKSKDTRTPKYVAEFGDECWELDAIPPDDLQSLVISSIEQYIDRDRWNKVLKQEEKDRASLKERFANADLDLGGDSP